MTNYLDAAIEAARAAGDLLRANFHQPLRVNAAEAHDIKLEIDVRTQELIEHSLLKTFPR
jgi:myo-inositol-1(or 4)-monophosphatase